MGATAAVMATTRETAVARRYIFFRDPFFFLRFFFFHRAVRSPLLSEAEIAGTCCQLAGSLAAQAVHHHWQCATISAPRRDTKNLKERNGRAVKVCAAMRGRVMAPTLKGEGFQRASS